MTTRKAATPIRTRGDYKRLLMRARTIVSVLRTPGHRFNGPGERQAVADVIDLLMDVAQRRHGVDGDLDATQDDAGDMVVTDLFGAIL